MSSTTTTAKPKPKRRSSAGAPSSLPIAAVDPKLMELARQIGLSRFNALAQSRASNSSTSAYPEPAPAPAAAPTPAPIPTIAPKAESSRSQSTKTSGEGKSGSKRKSVSSAAPLVIKATPIENGNLTSKQHKHNDDDDNDINITAKKDVDERKARKKQRKLEKKEARRKAALESERDMEVDQFASPVKAVATNETDSKQKNDNKEREKRDKEEKKRLKKGKKLDKGKGKEIVQDTPSESSSSAANDHPSPAPKAAAEPKSKSKSSSKRARPSDIEVEAAIRPEKSPRKKRKLANGSSAAVSSPQANTAVSAPPRPAADGVASPSVASPGLEHLLTQTMTALRASPSYAHESGVFGNGIVELFQALVAKVASADKRRNAPSASNIDDDESTTPDEDEHEREQSRSGKQDHNLGRTPLTDAEDSVASTSTSFSTHAAATSKRPAHSPAAPTADAAETETETEAAIKARAAKAAKKLLKKERREKKQQKELAAEAPSSPPEEPEVISAAPVHANGPATPLSSPNKSERPNKERPIRRRLGKLEKGALRSMSQSAGSLRQSSLAPTSALPLAREEIVIKVSNSQAEEAERVAVRAAEAATESSASSPEEDASLSHSTDPASRFQGVRDDVSESEIDQLASKPALARPFNPLRQAPPSTVSAFSSEDDPEEIELSLKTHASPRKGRPLSLDPEVQSEEDSEPLTEDDDAEEEEEVEGDVNENENEHKEEKPTEKKSEKKEQQPEIEHEDTVKADAQAQDEASVEEDIEPSSPTTSAAVPLPSQPSPVDPVNIPLPPSPSPPPPIRTIGHDDDSDASSSSNDDDSDSSSSSTASNRAYRKPSRPSIGAAATSTFGSPASMRKNRAKRRSSPLKTSSLAQNLSSTGPEVDKDAEIEEDIDELLSQPVPKSAVQKLLQDAEMEEQRLEEPRNRSTSVSSSEDDTNKDRTVAESSKEDDVEKQRNGGGDAADSTQSLKDVNSSLETAIAAPVEAANLSDIAAQASSAPGSPLMMDTQGSQLVRPDYHGNNFDESQYVPLIKGKPLFLEATQQTQRFPGVVDNEDADESQKSSPIIRNDSSQVKKVLDAVTLDVPSQATANGRLTRAASLRARTASPGPSSAAPPTIASSAKSVVSARPPSTSQPLPTTSFRGHVRASSMRALSQLDEATPRRSMRHAGPSASQGSAISAKGAAAPSLSWVRKTDDGETESEDDSSDDEDRKASSSTVRKSKVLWS
ncbi:BQ2448_4752 [Microbotryum intermedium]|uniref:BQ2448_4752 protein n=1 Tax=Microbotryum intermedium TaxID=269621 RepID=A0A238FLK7_9BASI|nr:BQ2448_4752 [Microbotryum intermedium]